MERRPEPKLKATKRGSFYLPEGQDDRLWEVRTGSGSAPHKGRMATLYTEGVLTTSADSTLITEEEFERDFEEGVYAG